MMEHHSFTGFSDIMFEDFIAGEAQGAVPDRNNAFVCTADMAIMFLRRQMLEQMRRCQDGEGAAFAHSGSFNYAAVQAVATYCSPAEDWRSIADSRMNEGAVTVSQNG